MSERHVEFRAGGLPAVVLVATVALVATLSVASRRALLGTDVSPLVGTAWGVPFWLLLAVCCLLVLRFEDVQLSELGLAPSALRPAAVTFGALWVWLVVAGSVFLFATEGIGALRTPWEHTWYALAALLVLQVATAGLGEELLFRGYLQSKCVASFDATGRPWRLAVAVLAAGTAFALVHVPTRLMIDGVAPSAIPFALVPLVLTSAFFGVAYYLTRNVWFVGFAHAFANVWPVPFDPTAVPAFSLLFGVSMLAVAVGYRRWIGREPSVGDAEPVGQTPDGSTAR